jgi:hypothetical protein
MKSVSSKDYLLILNEIDFLHKAGIQGSNSPHVVNGSDLAHVINRLVPYNPVRIIREASRIAVEAGISGAENWSISDDGVYLCRGEHDEVAFFAPRRLDIDPSDSDKLACLEVLASVSKFLNPKS